MADMNDTSMIKKIVDWMIKIIYETHTYFMSINDSYESSLSDKQLHFLIIGILGIAMLLVIYPLFRWLAKKHLTVLISWFYVFTVLVVITFAIEIAQWYSNTGTMDFNDIVAGLAGYFAMSFVFILVVGVVALIRSFLQKKKKKEIHEREESEREKKIRRQEKIIRAQKDQLNRLQGQKVQKKEEKPEKVVHTVTFPDDDNVR